MGMILISSHTRSVHDIETFLDSVEFSGMNPLRVRQSINCLEQIRENLFVALE